MQKDDDKRLERFRSVLESIANQTKPIETVNYDYSRIFDKLEALERQYNADIRIKHEGELTVWTRFLNSVKVVGTALDELLQVKPLSALSAVAMARGTKEPSQSIAKEFALSKHVQGGTLHLIISERASKQCVALKLWVTDEQGNRLDDFLLSITDEETGEPFFTDKPIRASYFNEEVGEGQYIITVKGRNVEGSIQLMNQ